MSITTTITALPDPPQRSDPANFPTKADSFVNALPDFGTEVNSVGTEINTTTTTVNGYKTAAATSATEAAASATAAAAIAGLNNFQGAWSAGTYTIGQSVSHDSKYWVCIPASTTGEPGVSADWQEIGSVSVSIKSAALHFLTRG